MEWPRPSIRTRQPRSHENSFKNFFRVMAITAMATSSSSFGLRICNPLPEIRSSAVQFTQFIKTRTSISSLSSSHSISVLQPLVLSQVSAPFCKKSQPTTIVCAKGYKMKTHKASAKRFRVSGSGKILRRRAGKQHLLAKKNTKRKLRLSKMVQVDRSDYNNVIGALPYLKVNRSN